MSASNLPMVIPSKKAWNHGRIIGQKRPLLSEHIWATRGRLELAGATRDLAHFNMAIDSKLRGCDLVRLKVHYVYAAGTVKQRACIVQSKTSTPVRFEITEGRRKSLAEKMLKINRRIGRLQRVVNLAEPLEMLPKSEKTSLIHDHLRVAIPGRESRKPT